MHIQNQNFQVFTKKKTWYIHETCRKHEDFIKYRLKRLKGRKQLGDKAVGSMIVTITEF
jgi:myosin-crossreactive antigen